MTRPIVLTGAGGDIGIAVARCLREIAPEARLIGADCRSDTPAAAFFDHTVILPLASSDSYLTELETVAAAQGASLIIPLAEAELAVLLVANLLQAELGGARVVSANPAAVAIGLDKLATNRRLREAGCVVPESGLVGEQPPGAFTVIIKPRSGQGSKRIEIVEPQSYAQAVERRRGDLWQRLLPNEYEEYTCGIARFPGMPTRVISFRRRLAGGLTGTGTLVDQPVLEQLGAAVAEALDLRGSINMQLRLERGVPMVFEVNPRFSSTVRFRHLLGFRDVAWSLEDAMEQPISEYAPPQPGARIFRVGEEVILPPS